VPKNQKKLFSRKKNYAALAITDKKHSNYKQQQDTYISLCEQSQHYTYFYNLNAAKTLDRMCVFSVDEDNREV